MPVLIPSGFRPGPARTTVRIPVGERGGVAAWRASDGAVSSLFMPKDEDTKPGQEWLRGERKRGGREGSDSGVEDLDSLRQSLLGMEEGREEDEGGVEEEKRRDGSGPADR